MTTSDLLWWALVQVTILCGLVLTVGTVVLSFVRQPADRLRVIQWVLIGCLIAPWLPGISTWKTISLNVVRHSRDNAGVVANTRTERVSESQISVDAAANPKHHEPAIPHESTVSGAAFVPASVSSSDSSPEISSAPGKDTFILPSLHTILLAAYMTALVIMIGWWAVGMRRRNHLEKSAVPASLELQQRFASLTRTENSHVRLLVSDIVSGPMTWGLVRPVIVIPTPLTEPTNESQLRWSLAHELSHIERRDVATLALASLVQLICFYQPFYWWMRRQMSLCQDFLADAKASREFGTTEDYAEFLVRLATSRIQTIMPVSLGIAEGKSKLYRRVNFLLNFEEKVASTCSRTTALCSGVTATSCFALLTTVSLVAEDSNPSASEVVQQVQLEPAKAPSEAERPKLDQQPKSQNNVAESSLKPVDESLLEQEVVTGRCVTVDGKPVPDATVILHAGRSDKTKTNAEGEFRLEKIPARDYAYPVWAHQGNRISKKVLVSALKNDDPKIVKFAPLVLVMTEGKKAKFIVTSEVTNQPVAGANVRFGYPDRRLVKTDDHGIATVEGLLPENYEAWIEAAGHARNAPPIDLSNTGPVTEFKISLKPGGLVRGTVVDAKGKRLPGVSAYYYVAGSHNGIHGDAFFTDDEGRFQNSNLPLNMAVKISISKDGYLPIEQQILATADHRELEVELTLPERPAGGFIRGTITNQGKPIADAEIENHRSRKTKSDSAGNFELNDLLEGPVGHQIVVSAKGFAPQHITVTPGTVEKPGIVDVKLEPGHRIRGRIELEDGSSPEGTHIYVRSPQLGFMPGFRIVSADEKGDFEFDSLPADARFDVTVKKYSAIQAEAWKLDGNDRIVVKIAAPGAINGRVLDQVTKQPISNFRITLDISRQTKATDPKGLFQNEWVERGLTFKSEKGEFAFTPMVVGSPVELSIDAEGYERAIVERAVATKPDQKKSIDVYLKPMKSAKTFTLKGQFLKHSGKPAANAPLRLIVSADQPKGANDNDYNWALIDSEQLGQKPYCSQYLSGTTDADGRFEFKGIQAERYLQLAYWGKGVPRGRSLAFDETVAGGQEEVTIRLPQPARVTGTIDRARIADADGVRMNSQAVDFLGYDLKLKDDETTFEFDDLPPGKYWISVTSKPKSFTENGNTFFSSANIASKQLQLKPGQTEKVEFNEPDKPAK